MLFLQRHCSVQFKKNKLTNSGIIAAMLCGAVGTVIGMVMNTAINYAAVGILFSFVGMMIACAVTTKKKDVI